MSLFSIYRCPRSGVRLVSDGPELRAEGDGITYKVCEGIPQLLCYEPAESDEVRAQLRHVTDLATRIGWRESLIEVYGEGSATLRYVTDESRLGYLDLINLTDQSVVLEIGASMGQCTQAIARRVERVHALEAVSGQARFAAERCRQEGLSNVSVDCGGDNCRLPYEDGLFDAVMINLVLEWCAVRAEGQDFEVGQRLLLAEALRVLKPGGQFYVATKNRFALRYLLGGADEHADGMHFGNALPRWLMAYLLRRRRKSRPDGQLYSYPQLRRMLLAAGFDRVRPYWAVPDMRYPAEYVAMDGASTRAARRRPGFVQHNGRIMRLLMGLIPAPLVRYLAPGHVFVAMKKSIL